MENPTGGDLRRMIARNLVLEGSVVNEFTVSKSQCMRQLLLGHYSNLSILSLTLQNRRKRFILLSFLIGLWSSHCRDLD